MGRQTNNEVEVNVEGNQVETYDDTTITNEQYSIRPPPPHVFQLNKSKVKKLKAFLMYKGNPTSGKKDALQANLKEVIGYVDIFTVEYSSEIVDANVVTNEVNQIQNDIPPIAWAVMNGEHYRIVEHFTDDFSAPTNMDN